MKKQLLRLGALQQVPGRKLGVDRSGTGRILGASVITTGPALGHGFNIDHKTVAQVARALNGIPGRWTHGSLSEDGLGRHLGRWQAGQVERFHLCRGCELEEHRPAELGDVIMSCPGCGKDMELASRAFGDFVFSKSAHKIKPDGLDTSAPDYLMDRAEEDPTSFGTSVVAAFDLEPVMVLDDEGDEVEQLFARLADAPRALLRPDFVADPAANPVGLHAGTNAMSEVLEAATKNIGRMLRKLGADETRRRALRFVDRVLEAHKENAMKVDGKKTSEILAASLAEAAAVNPADPVKDQDIAPGTDTEDDGADEADPDEEGDVVTEGPIGAAPELEKKPEEKAEPMPDECGANPELGLLGLTTEFHFDSGNEFKPITPAPTAAELRVKELEGQLAAERLSRVTERVDQARTAALASGVTMTQEERTGIIEALTSSDSRTQKLGSMLLDRFSAAASKADKDRTSVKNNPATTEKVDLEAEKTKEDMLLGGGVQREDIVKDSLGRIDFEKTRAACRDRALAQEKTSKK